MSEIGGTPTTATQQDASDAGRRLWTSRVEPIIAPSCRLDKETEKLAQARRAPRVKALYTTLVMCFCRQVNSTISSAGLDPHSEPRPRAPRYQWLLFDADGTIFDFEQAEAVSLGQAFGQMGVPFESRYLASYRRINQTLWQAVENGQITPGVVKVRRFELLLESLQVAGSPALWSDCYVKCLASCSQPLEHAVEVLSALRARYRLAILTNGLKEVQLGRLARSAFTQHISEIVISEEVGAAKPSERFFDAAFARLRNPSRSEVLMVGDGWASDIQGAFGYGIDACWYNPGRKPRPGHPPITREIASLGELVDWLG